VGGERALGELIPAGGERALGELIKLIVDRTDL